MNQLSRRFYEQLLHQLNQRTIRANRYKVALFTPAQRDSIAGLDPAPPRLTEMETDQTVFAFNLMFERNNTESAWRLVTPIKFSEQE